MPPGLPLLVWLRQQLADTPPPPQSVAVGLFSLTLAIPDGFCPTPALQVGFPQPCFYWQRPQQQHLVVGLGEAARCEASGENRFADLQHQFAALHACWHKQGLTTAIAAVMGYAFDSGDSNEGGCWQGFPNTLLYVPELLLEQQGQHTTLTLSMAGNGQSWDAVQIRWLALLKCLLAEGKPPKWHAPQPLPKGDAEELASTQPEWFNLVNQAKASIQRGGLHKLVVARHASQPLTTGMDAARLMRQMQQHYPGCTLLGMALGNDHWLMAATPERLVSLQDGMAGCDALAGTIAHRDRHAGFPSHMREAEHPPVVEAIRQALARVCADVQVGEQMQTLALPHLQHLWTEIRGKALPSVQLLDLLECLHPTPAINGFPATPARQWLRTHGNHRRGWYSGGVGWMRHNGDGELSVLLRCALLQAGEVCLFAGAGIVAGSDPQQEWDETELKLDTLRRLLDAAN